MTINEDNKLCMYNNKKHDCCFNYDNPCLFRFLYSLSYSNH